MKVLWLTKTFGIGGTERLLLELLPHMGGVEFIPVAVSAASTELEPSLRKAGLEPKTLGAGGPYDARWLGRIRSIVKSARPDILHLHNPVSSAGARISTLGLPSPIITTEHNVWESYHPASRWAAALTLWRDDATIAVSEAVARSIRRSIFGRGADVVVIRNGIDAGVVATDAEPEPGVDVPPGSFGTVTHLRHRKGVDVLIRAAAILERTEPGRKCLIAGEGPLGDRLSEQARSVKSVEFLGIREDARSMIRSLDVFVLPSRYEGLPLVLLEAMALARPIVATTAGGVPEVLDDSCGVLVPPGDPVALADAIAGLLREPDRAAELGVNARKAVEARGDIRRTARELSGIYESVLAR
ncbi:MAG: glycosyltransferase family 4 protein [Actinomycetota bacterium]